MDYFYTSGDGLRLYCRIYPARRPGGVPVLCLPGLTRNSRDFADLALHLSAEHEVLAADLRGRGLSAWDSDPTHYQIPTYVEDAWTLLDSRGIDRVLIVGTSLGALMGMAMAMRPERVAGVVLNDAGPEIELAGVQRIAGYAGKLPPVANWAQAAEQARIIHQAALPDLTEAQWMDYARRNYRENSAGIPVPDMDPQIAAGLRAPQTAPLQMWPLYAQIRGVPMLVIRGALSDLLSAATVERMLREKPDLRHVTVPNRGHTPRLDEPESLAAIDAFLAEYGRDRGAAGRMGSQRRTPEMTTLTLPSVSSLLERLFAEADATESSFMAERARLSPEERAARAGNASDYKTFYMTHAKNVHLAVSRETATLLYMLARSMKARSIVEFGTSFGISTLYLAAALKDNGGGRVIGSEFEPSKVARARANMAAAGLADLVDIREGDALETLSRDLPEAIDLVLLDGAKTLYPRVLALLAPRLRSGAMIVADNADMCPEYLAIVRAPGSGYLTVPLAGDVELTMKS
jgi:predicted O-methyltransferase YrrM/pimeloyl-ACP methyl ester carboxylesterase